MKILIAPDSFKDALPALQVCEAIRKGVLRAWPGAEVQLFPMADGGEGTAEVLAWHLEGELVEVVVSDPLFRPVTAHYFSRSSGTGAKKAFVEMAQASGLQLLKPAERNPLKTSTYGTGELIMHAIRSGATEIYLAIGGSATNDAGMGMAAAMGWRFFSKSGDELAPIGENLQLVDQIIAPVANPQSVIRNPPSFTVLCDVDNPLHGPSGAAQVFAAQKGAGDDAILLLDGGLRHFSGVVEATLDKDFSGYPGAGAAGGLGFGALAFLGAAFCHASTFMLQLVGFEAVAKGADLLITGEGKLDSQTARGKLVATICEKAKNMGIPILAICGTVNLDAVEIESLGLSAAVQLRLENEPLEDSIKRTPKALEEATYNALKNKKIGEWKSQGFQI